MQQRTRFNWSPYREGLLHYLQERVSPEKQDDEKGQ